MRKKLPLFLLLLLAYPFDTTSQNATVLPDRNSFELLLILNQPSFAPGDTALFKAFLIGDTNNLVPDKKILNLALYKDQQLVHYQRFILNHDEASGSIHLHPTIKGGVYTILAEIDGLFFEGVLSIADEYSYSIASLSSPVTTPLLVGTNLKNEVVKTGELHHVKIYPKQELKDFRGNFIATLIQDNLFDKSTFWVRLQQRSSIYKKSSYPTFFSGKIISTKDKNIPDSVKVTFFLKNNELIYSLYASPSGEVTFPLFLNFESDNIFYLISHRFSKITDLRLRVDQIFENHISATPVGEIYSETPDPYWEFSRKRQAIQKSYSFFIQEGNQNQAQKHENDFSGDYEVQLDKYESFTTMHELVNTIIPTVKYRKNSKNEWIRIFMKEKAQMTASDPIYIIDGVMTDSTLFFLSLDPAKIKSVKILRSADKLRKFGDLGKNGIIIVDSKIPGGLSAPLSTHSFLVTGITKVYPLTSSPKSLNPKVPDTRSCLYWNDTLTLSNNNEATLTFHTGDLTGLIKLVILEISDTGTIFYHEETTDIVFQKR